MQNILSQYVFLILIILGLVMVSNKLRLPYPIVLVLGGLILSFTTQFSKIIINPEVVFQIFLPPLLYEAAWQVSWKEFWKWRRVIISFAFPIVVITSFVIALVSHALIPGFTLALGFLLGGIISPPDAISATAIMRQLNVPKSLMRVAEGESLLNDASSLIIFRFAVAAAVTGQFHLGQASLSFILVVAIGTMIGLVIGFIIYGIHRWLLSTPSIEVVLTLVTPYCMYYAAEYFNASGVLSVVCGGLFLSNKRHSMLTYESRIQGVNVWSNLTFLVNGMIFLLIGLQLPNIIKQLGDISLVKAVFYGLVISAVLILTRLICTLATSPFTKFMSRFINVADDDPGWRSPLVLGWAGMRGVISLAAALAIPILISEGHPFPFRNLILFITFIVILVTLVLQGLTLPWLIRKVRPEDKHTRISEPDQEILIQKKLSEHSLKFMEKAFGKELPDNIHVSNLYQKLKMDLAFFDQEIEAIKKDDSLKKYQRIYLRILEDQRKLLNKMNQSSDYDEELIRKYYALIDLEEFKIRESRIGED